MGNQIFFEIGPHLPTVPGGFLNRVSQNMLISIEIKPLLPNMNCWYSYLVHFREEDINDLESCIWVTLLLTFLIFRNLLKKNLNGFSLYCQIKGQSV